MCYRTDVADTENDADTEYCDKICNVHDNLKMEFKELLQAYREGWNGKGGSMLPEVRKVSRFYPACKLTN